MVYTAYSGNMTFYSTYLAHLVNLLHIFMQDGTIQKYLYEII